MVVVNLVLWFLLHNTSTMEGHATYSSDGCAEQGLPSNCLVTDAYTTNWVGFIPRLNLLIIFVSLIFLASYKFLHYKNKK